MPVRFRVASKESKLYHEQGMTRISSKDPSMVKSEIPAVFLFQIYIICK